MAAPLLPVPLRDGERLTRDEFLRRWEAMPDLMRAELIDGVVCMPSPVSKTHSDFQVRLTILLGTYAGVTAGCSAGASGTWLMSSDSAPQPDLALSILPECGGQSRVERDYPVGAPELVIEISHTTGARDSGAKLRLHERSGVREYVTVTPRHQQILWRELHEGRYRNLDPGSDGWFRSRVFPGLWLDPLALWMGDLEGIAAAVRAGVKLRA